MNKDGRSLNNPWPVFIFFVLTNGLLAYTQLSVGMKVAAGLAGLLFPFGWLLWRSKGSFLKPGEIGKTSWPRLSPWVLALLIGAAFYLRSCKLSSFSTWPSTDEAWVNSYALDLYEKWNWDLLYGHMKVAPLSVWVPALFFKLLSPSLFSLYLLPALISLGTIYLAYA